MTAPAVKIQQNPELFRQQINAALAELDGKIPSTEAVQDTVAAMLVAGANITLTYNDAAGTLTIAAGAGGVSGDGLVSNNAGTLTGRTLTAGSGISVTNGSGTAGNPTVALALTEALIEAALTNVSFGNAQVEINSTKVLGAQQAAISDLGVGPTNAQIRTTVNAILAALRAHGLIAT